jgi:hypothetical protein
MIKRVDVGSALFIDYFCKCIVIKKGGATEKLGGTELRGEKMVLGEVWRDRSRLRINKNSA